MSVPALDDATLQELYEWVDSVPLPRKHKNITKDFADGALVAELVAHFLPRYVDLHNYVPASAAALKKYNWETLNKLVFVHLNFNVSKAVVDQVVGLVPGAIEHVLYNLRIKIELAIAQQQFKPSRRYRSRSSCRESGSTSSINSVGLDDDSDCNHHVPKRANFNLQRFAISTPSSARQKLCEDLVPGRLLHSAQQDILMKEEQIQTLQARIRHLERLVSLKDDRIAQLTQRLDRIAQVFYQHQQRCVQSEEEKEEKQPNVEQIVKNMLAQHIHLNIDTGAEEKNQ